VIAHTAAPGMLGLASQSGTYVAQTLAYLRKRGIRFSKAISMGNEANIDIVEALEYLGEDEDTKAITLYIEGIRDGRRFIKAAQKITPHKPIVAQYVGGTVAGARAGGSHTGSMAGPDYLYNGIFEQAGIIRVYSVDELFGEGWALATQPLLKGKRVGVVTNSGGPGSTISYTCNKGGLEVPCFSDELQEEVKKYIPPHASSVNPVDFTFFLNTKMLSNTMPEIVMKSNEVDGVVLHGVMGPGLLKENYEYFREFLGNMPLETLVEQSKEDISGSVILPWKYGMPMVVSTFFDGDDDYTLAYQHNNIPVYDAPEKAAKAMVACYKYKNIRERKEIIPPVLPARSEKAEKIILDAVRRGQTALDEYDSKRVLAAYGIPVTGERLIHSVDEAIEAAEALGFPVAVKGCSAEIMHKTEKGLIYLNRKNKDEVTESLMKIRESAGENLPVLISKMVEGQREFLAGITRFPGFGPCVLFGVGGVFAEALDDVTIRQAPLSDTEAEEMIFSIKMGKILTEFRGMPAVDVVALAAILQRVSYLALLHPEIAEMDLNPVIIQGALPVIADALIVLAKEE
jgi:acetyltransferase